MLEETGLLPHLNPGVLSWADLQRLKPVAPSMGMMLETTATRLWSEPGGPHFGSPDKEPAVRLRVLADAGRVGVPFTTGILIGIGETADERADALFEIRHSMREFGHIQEVIVQNFRAKPDTAMRGMPDAELDDLAATIAVARIILGPRMRIQAPPNLIDDEYALLLRAGIDDWGGVSPLTPDHVNPERPWPAIDELAARTAAAGFQLAERLDDLPGVRAPRRAVAGSAAGRARRRAGRSGDRTRRRGFDPGRAGRGRSPMTRTPRAGVPTCSPKSTPSVAPVTGAGTSTRSTATGRRSPRTSGPPPIRLCSPPTTWRRDSGWPPTIRRRCSTRATRTRHWHCSHADGPALDELARIADGLRRDTVGDDVTYVVNRNINFTNVCYVGCRFCAFAQRERDADAYRLSVEQVADRAEEAWRDGATEVCMQGGIDPKMPNSGYADLVRAVKRRVPGMHVHAFSPMEIVTAASKAGVSVADWLTALKEAGLDTIPGTAAEILDDDVRWVLTKGKLPAAAWIDVVTTAHRLGIRSSATMMYGHVDHPAHWLGHFRVLAGIQDQTGGFTEFVALPFIHTNAPIYLAGYRPGRCQLAGEPSGSCDGADPAARAHRQHPVLLGEARRRRNRGDAQRRRQRPGRHADGGDDLPDGRLGVRIRTHGCTAQGRSRPRLDGRLGSARRPTRA